VHGPRHGARAHQGASSLMGGWPALLGVLPSTLGDEHAPNTPVILDYHV